jgi:photosynthetic reaction center cytochrome c subunit
MSIKLWVAALVVVILGVAMALTLQRPPVDVVQRGYRGTAMAELFNPGELAAKVAANQLPEAIPVEDATGTPASAVYSNVQVLGDVDAGEVVRLMTAMTSWVAPQQGCGYCHDLNDLASDKLYTKVVARRMIQMVRHINSRWKTHVAATGVTCYTCHRGQPVPKFIWFENPGPPQALGMLGNRAGVSAPLMSPGESSLPYDPFTPFLSQTNDIRVISTSALPDEDHKSIKQTEWTYALMMHISQALGVNCTFCHNTRSFFDWDQSTPQRTIAYFGIRLVRDLNIHFLQPLKGTLPAARLGALGDGPKLNCATCHQGVNKPLLGASMVSTYPELTVESAPSAPSAPPATPAPPSPGPAPSPAPPAPDAPK